MKKQTSPGKIVAETSKQYESYRDGIINDIDFIGTIYELCREYLEEELNKMEGRTTHIKEFLD